ncbi:MAG: FAD-binding oxidoreductase [Chloroflexota bacterium]|jgi:alkyldihydroxyacetonephosphate synthase
MRRWNGWGDDTIDYPIPPTALNFLEDILGSGIVPHDATMAEVVNAMPPSRLEGIGHPLVRTEAQDRLRHARGQSLPDWVELRSGRITEFPDGVAYPASTDQIISILNFASSTGTRLIPYGGGTSVVGHINSPGGSQPTLTVNLRRLNQLSHWDSISHLAGFGAGITGPELEAQLRARGFTLGHYPQSFEYSTLGGWVVTRSSGQQSLGFGRIENLFAGGTLLTPAGRLDLPPFPASAAGPDLRQIVLGSEGRMGILTDVTLRISPRPELEEFHAIFFPSFIEGMTAVRQLVQEQLPLSLIRLSTPVETRTTLALAGHERLIGLLESMLGVRGAGEEKSMLLCGFTGRRADVHHTRRATVDICKEQGGIHVGRRFGDQWIKGRFRTPYLRNALWEHGYAVDTVETATNWENIPRTLERIEAALREGLAGMDEPVHVFTHLSHVYPQGASIYSTYLFRIHEDSDETIRRWTQLKKGASQAIIASGGTISHQHGVGRDHAPYLAAEKGALGIAAISDVLRRFDPDGIMNPGVLISEAG